jgi:hypothetical protein
MLGTGVSFVQHGEDVLQRLANLRRHPFGEALLLIPTNLAGHEHLAALGHDAVCISLRAGPAGGLQHLNRHFKTSRAMINFCTSVAPS